MQAFDKLWNYANPAETEVKFREVESTLNPQNNLSEWLQLQTQIARTYSLRRKFVEAHETLNKVKPLLPAELETAHVRYYLELGRTHNSAGNKPHAQAAFETALMAAKQLSEDFYAVDAVHMLAIVAPPDEAIRLNEEGVLLAEASTQERAKGWLGALYNNLAWSYFDKGEYEKALSIFLRALKWREERQSAPEIFLAKWCVARTLRALNRVDEAITIQLALLEEMVETDKPDGFVYEELGELHLLKNDPVHKMYFQFAYNQLSTDAWLAEKEPARLARMKELAQ